MKLETFIKILQKHTDLYDKEVLVSSDAEGNDFHPIGKNFVDHTDKFFIVFPEHQSIEIDID